MDAPRGSTCGDPATVIDAWPPLSGKVEVGMRETVEAAARIGE
ncbi:MAG: hypothetical protein ACYSWU_21505 [Planctomycetota bacterium]|jgi:hypothetical protein